MKSKVFVIFLLLMTSIIAIFDYDGVKESPPPELYGVETNYWNESHQFQNMLGASYANATNISILNEGFLHLNMEVMTYFSDMSLWNGNFNLSIYANETELLWREEINQTGYNSYSWSYNNTTAPTNITIYIRATGMDTHPQSDMADYFILYMEINNEWRVR
jgi:hypothetical protein